MVAANQKTSQVFVVEEMKGFLAGLLTAGGTDKESASLCADIYIRAELSGLGSRGASDPHT